ncbi:hypothetical protein JW851_01260 [Candidatus Woesearchaeota archaeon]|nr:hypothetical protein [Candidatus Woesearchaeota archaeon]
MVTNEKAAEIYIGHAGRYDYGTFKHPGNYLFGIMIDGKKIFTSSCFASEGSIIDRAKDIVLHLRKRDISKYTIINGSWIEDIGINKGKLVECNSVLPEVKKFFADSIDLLLKNSD